MNGGSTNYYVRGVDGQTMAVFGSSGTAKFFNIVAGGEILGTVDGSQRHYFLKDHLGSIRTTVDQSGMVDGYDDYYPFGLTMPTRADQSDNPNYKFTGHELDIEADLNIYHMNARAMDPVLGRFMQIDPLASEFPNISPYAYGNNNPLRYTDPTGMAPMDWIKDLETDEYKWDNNVNSATDTPEGFAYVGKSLDDVAADFDASTPGYDFWSKPNVNTDGWPGEIRTTQEGFWDGRENNIGYGFINSPWVAIQTLNPRDNQVTHLNGNLTTHNERIEAGAFSAPIGFGTTQVSKMIRFMKYPNAGGAGVNIFRNGKRVFGVDWHRFKLNGKMVNRPHYHRGPTKSQMSKHRPWQGGW